MDRTNWFLIGAIAGVLFFACTAPPADPPAPQVTFSASDACNIVIETPEGLVARPGAFTLNYGESMLVDLGDTSFAVRVVAPYSGRGPVIESRAEDGPPRPNPELPDPLPGVPPGEDPAP